MLPKAHRAVEKKLIIPTIREGQKTKFGSLSFYLFKIDVPLKVVVIVSKKVSKLAVQRNLLRRRIYSAIKDLNVIDGSRGVLVIRAYPGSSEREFSSLQKDIGNYFHK